SYATCSTTPSGRVSAPDRGTGPGRATVPRSGTSPRRRTWPPRACCGSSAASRHIETTSTPGSRDRLHRLGFEGQLQHLVDRHDGVERDRLTHVVGHLFQV